MINGKTVLALIPARGGSKGLPRKNIMELCGKPLLGWPIQAARGSNYVDKVVVSTDDREIAEKALEQGAEVPFIRPAELATDTASSISVIEHAISTLMKDNFIFDYLVLLEPTSPLTESADIDLALEKIESKRDIADSIVGVSRVEATHPVFDVLINEAGLIQPFWSPDFSSAKRRQEIDELYFFEGSLYISDTSILLQKKGFYHDRTLPYVVPKWKAFEVDDLIDFICIEAIMNNLDKIKKCRGNGIHL
jgi:N-acylneuraminate cytidylyltransferase/CMP-N,N'-diacetyllegionaminic acid synthase